MRTFKQWWFWYTPQTPDYDKHWLAGLRYRLRRMRSDLPLLTLTSFWWWRRIVRDIKAGKCERCTTCNRSWFSIHVLPAIVGEKIIPPCAR